ncbi:hypothetical protein OROMI_005311 [Orobanche minor]
MENIETLLAAVAQTQGFDDDDEPAVSAAPERGLENSESSPVVPGDARPSVVVDMPPPAPMPAFSAAERVIGAGEKRKRGRPSKGKLPVKPPPPCKRSKQEDEEEDVCFICFDGGSLVLCDRKGCPKAYHPTCIKRDEAFFKSKAKWNCGWHICSVCRKASYYVCYTCTYSLCKGCIKDADYVRVRGNNGFCSTCMKTIMLVENKGQADNGVEVDFDDQTSWEYLFKMYWVILKEKLSLTLNELTRAKNPWKGVAPVGYKLMSSNVIPAAVSVDLPITHTSMEHLDLKKPVEIDLPPPSNCSDVGKTNNENGGDGPAKPTIDEVMQLTSVDEEATDEPGIEKNQDDLNTTKDTDKTCICKNTKSQELENRGIYRNTEWAKKDLLEFVAQMKNGDMTAISRFDVQTLLLDYINSNSLWDPCRKSQIICDPRLENLFGKPRVDNVDMLKLLESHFLVKEDSKKDSFIPVAYVSPVKCNMEVDEIEEDSGIGDNNSKDEYVKPSYSVFPQNRRKSISPNREDKEETDPGESNSLDKHTNQVDTTNLATDGKNYQNYMPGSGPETPTTTASVGNSPSSNIMEIEKLWHYRDPNGKIRGPFSMMQLREFNATGLYLPDTRIWTNHEQYDSLLLTDALNGKFHGASDFSNSGWQEEGAAVEIASVREATNVSSGDSEQIDKPTSNVSVLSENNNTGVVRADESGSWPQCWDFLKDSNNSSGEGAQARDLLHSSGPEKEHEALPDCGRESNEFYHGSQNGEIKSTGPTQNPITGGCGVQNEDNNEDQVGISSEENSRSLNIDLGSDDLGLPKSPDSNKQGGNMPGLDYPSPIRPNTDENRQPAPSDAPMQNFGFLELLSPAPRCNNEDQACQAFETKNSGFLNFPMPNSSQVWNGASCLGVGGVQIPDLADDWCGISSAFSLKPPEITCENIAPSSSDDHHQLLPSHSNIPNWLANINEPIEFDALGEESVSDLLAEVDAMESQGPLYSPNSAIKFAREFLEDCKDDCFSSIEEFSSSTPELRKSDTLSSTSETQLNSQSCKPINAFDSLTRPNVHASVSSEVETNTAGLEFHLHAPNAGQDVIGATMGNINLVTVQGNVNLVLGGPAGQGMADLGWGTNSGTGWVNPNLNLNCGPANGSLPWDGQRKYNGERYTSPREWGYQGGRGPWGRQQPPPYGGGGYARPLVPKGQRVCKFYESGRCKKGAFCDYLHT